MNEYFHVKCDIHNEYVVVLGAVTQQVKNFRQTGYTDARTDAELYLENHLEFNRGAFILRSDFFEIEEGYAAFFAMMDQIGGPRLLPSEDMADTPASADTNGQSFRSDRRLVRLAIFRAFIDNLMRKFKASDM